MATLQGGAAYYIMPDHLGAPHEIVNSANGRVWFWDHDPYGNGAPSAAAGFSHDLRFPGQIYDAETRLHNNGFRDYDPRLGRYVESDPIGLAGGINTYVYAGNDPVNAIDPLGLDPESKEKPEALPDIDVGKAKQQYAQALTLCAGGPLGCAAGAGITGAQVLVGGAFATAVVGGAKAGYDYLMNKSNPPPGSKPIDKTPWSGDHQDIKENIGSGPADKVKISPSGDVWGENPDGSWTNHGPAGAFTNSGNPRGQRGRDRRN